MSDRVDLHDVLTKHQDAMLAKLKLARSAFGNAEMKGDATEGQWHRVIESFLPGRYQCSAAKVIDCHGATSDFIDIVIHDRHFCPLLFEMDDQRYVPAESVYAAFEVKQELTKADIDYATAKAESVRCLHRTSIAFDNAGKTTEPRELFTIVTGILTTQSGWTPPFGAAFRGALKATKSHLGRIDVGCALRDGAFDIDWTDDGPAVLLSQPEGTLMFFLLRLFARLQALGTVSAIDIAAYGASLEVYQRA